MSIQSLQTAMSGLMAARRQLEIHGHNIANVSTEGYTIQRQMQQAAGVGATPRVFATTPLEPGGVVNLGVERQTDALLRNRLNTTAEALGATKANAKYMTRIETTFAEPSDSGLAFQLNALWSSFGALSVSPDSEAARQLVLDQGNQVAYTFSRIDTELSGTLEFASSELAAAAAEINDTTAQIASLNQSILSAGTFASATSDLSDQRDRLIERLSSLTGAQAVLRPDGQAAVYLGGRLLVDNPAVMQVSATSTQLQWATDNAVVDAGGYVGSVHALVKTTIPQFRTKLDAVANQIISDVNTYHIAGADQNGVSGWNFFSGTGAGGIKLSADVDGQPSRVAAGAVGNGPNDGSTANLIGDLADSTTGADNAYMSVLAELGVTTRTARTRDDAQQMVVESARRDLNSVGQVNLDDELAELTGAQRAYQAAARVVTTVDEMLDTLIHHLGRVGT